jgi:hypothetical protein
MTRPEALKRCIELNDAPDAEPGVRWLAKQREPGEWTVVKLRVPGMSTKGPLSTSQESRPAVDAPDTTPMVNPNWGAG